MTQDQEDAFNGLIQRYQRLELSSFEFHREWRALGAPPASMMPEEWSELSGAERPEECDNLDELEGWWQVERQGHLVPGNGRKVAPSPDTKSGGVAIYLIVSVFSVFVAIPYGWPVVLAVLGVMALLIFPLRREMQHFAARSNRYEAAHAIYQKHRAELMERYPEQLRWEEARLEDLAELNNHADVERWWRHFQNRLSRTIDSINPSRPNRKQAIMMLVFSVVVFVTEPLVTWFDPTSVGSTRWTSIIPAAILGVVLFRIGLNGLRVAREYDLAEAAYHRRLEELSQDPAS